MTTGSIGAAVAAALLALAAGACAQQGDAESSSGGSSAPPTSSSTSSSRPGAGTDPCVAFSGKERADCMRREMEGNRGAASPGSSDSSSGGY